MSDILRNNFIPFSSVTMFSALITNIFICFSNKILWNISTFCQSKWLNREGTTKSSGYCPLGSWCIWSNPWVLCFWRSACSRIDTLSINWNRIIIWGKSKSLLCINKAKGTHCRCSKSESHIYYIFFVIKIFWLI